MYSNDEVVFTEINGVKYMQFKALLKYDNEINHALFYGVDYSTKDKDNSENYIDACKQLNIEYNSVCDIEQIHSDKYIYVNNKPSLKIECDASITNSRNLPLLVKTADCMAIFVYDYTNKYVSVIHAGWKGVLNRIAHHTIYDMMNIYKCNPESMIVCISPYICINCFEVMDDVKSEFEKTFNYDNFILKKDETHYLIDLGSIMNNELLNLGINKNNIHFSNYCTMCNDIGFYSFRKDKTAKRMASIILLK